MTTTQELIAAYNKLLVAKEKELLEKQNEVFKFVDAPHSIKGTKKYIKEMRLTEIEINTTISELLSFQQSASEFSKEAKKLYEQSKELKIYTKDINKTLSEDLAQKQLALLDPIKVAGFVAGLAVAFVNIAKNTFDPNLVHGAAETSAGALSGVAISYHKQIGTAFRNTAKSLLSLPREIKDSFFIYYVKEQSKETGKKLIGHVRNEKSFIIPVAPARNDNKKKDASKKMDVA